MVSTRCNDAILNGLVDRTLDSALRDGVIGVLLDVRADLGSAGATAVAEVLDRRDDLRGDRAIPGLLRSGLLGGLDRR